MTALSNGLMGFDCVALQTAFFPAAGIAWPRLLDVHRALAGMPAHP